MLGHRRDDSTGPWGIVSAGSSLLAPPNDQWIGVKVMARKGIARRGDVAVGIEVKGYPSRFYAAAGREGKQKPTQPATQARVWFDSAIVAAMRLRTSQPSLTSVVALPDFPTYPRLASGIAWGLERCEIQLWWVSDAGTVTAS